MYFACLFFVVVSLCVTQYMMVPPAAHFVVVPSSSLSYHRCVFAHLFYAVFICFIPIYFILFPLTIIIILTFHYFYILILYYSYILVFIDGTVYLVS